LLRSLGEASSQASALESRLYTGVQEHTDADLVTIRSIPTTRPPTITSNRPDASACRAQMVSSIASIQRLPALVRRRAFPACRPPHAWVGGVVRGPGGAQCR
jgi:hypothetical protein